jgi:hypothetical protein
MIAGALGEEIGWRGYLHEHVAPHLKGGDCLDQAQATAI